MGSAPPPNGTLRIAKPAPRKQGRWKRLTNNVLTREEIAGLALTHGAALVLGIIFGWALTRAMGAV
jgi:hypothetical protein